MTEAVEKSDRPGLAIVCNSLPPYRVHLHRRIVRELPEVRLWTLCTHEGTDSRWKFDPPQEINNVSFRQEQSPDKHGINLASWRKGGRVIQWLEQNRIRAVVVMGYNDPCRMRILRWGRGAGVRCFVFGDSNIRGDTASGIKASVKRLVVGWVIRHSDGMLPCGSLGRAFFEKYGASPQRVFYFPYEPDYTEIENVSADRVDAVLKGFGLARQRRRIVYSGRFVAVKRVEIAIRAFSAIAARRPEWDLVMAGDGDLREQLQAVVPAELKHRVFWTGFIHDQAALSALYRGSDVLILPSSNEPWALVINEAAAAGMAIVSSDVVGASAELVRDGVNGRIFPSGDQSKATEALLDVTDPGRIDAMKAASPMILEDWRRRADPIDGLRQALTSAGVLPRVAD